jgi:secreted PhoX family phosphatase
MTCMFRCGNACDHPVPNTTANPYFGDIVETALSRRAMLKGGAAGALVVGVGAAFPANAAAAAQPYDSASSAAPKTGTESGRGGHHSGPTRVDDLDWGVVAPNKDDKLTAAEGFDQGVVISWGDAVMPGAPEFDFDNQTSAAQLKQFGYNCDFLSILPLRRGFDGRERALLVANHEYTSEPLMFRGWKDGASATLDQLKISLAAHGLSVVEIERVGRSGQWRAVTSGRRSYNRRVTGFSEFKVTGPAAGHALLKTTADPSGTKVLGTLNNCAGGTTPWGTTLHGEENFNQYFEVSSTVDPAYTTAFKRYGLPTAAAAGKSWARVDERFDLSKNPNEANRFGWIVELDPYDPTSTPKKRTMLGRTKHEGATIRLARDGRAVAYLGDDERFDYLYKFVSEKRFREGADRHNGTLLDTGTLYVAKFTGDGTDDGEYDGTGEWIALTTDKKSFVPGMSVAEVLVNTRLAADKMGPTKMDRPEDVEPNPHTGKVYMACTNNSNRTAEQVDEANPRPANKHGHVVEMTEQRNDAASTRFTWNLLLVCGDPADPSTYFGGYDKTKVSPISCPDNVAFDGSGNLWISTDGNALGSNDGLFALPLEGRERGHVKQFLTVPIGAETCGPLISSDDRTVFVAVQHPGEVDGATPENPASVWPFGDQPRPSVACVWKD